MEKEMLVQLINKAKSGDQQAFEELLKEAHTPVSYQCRKMLDNEQDVEDATQEILLTIYTKLDTLEEPAAFYGWLGRITANQCKNVLRKHKDLQFAEDEDGNSVLDDLEDMDERQIPDKALDNAETARMIDEIVSQLPEAQRMTTLLFYYNEMSIKQIAEAMDIKEDAVKARLFNARKTIKAKVEGYEKQGIKLYSVSVLPLLWYFLRKSAQAQASGEAAAACAAGIMGAGATAAVVGGSVAAGGTAAAAAAMTAGAAVAGKIVAGIVAAALTISGIGFAITKLNDALDTTKPSYEQTQGSTMASTASSSTPTMPALNPLLDEVYAAYITILKTASSPESDLNIWYYAYLDVDRNGIPELIVSNNDGTDLAWTSFEVYTYDINGVHFCGGSGSRYTNIFYVNEKYVWGTDYAGADRKGSDYIGVEEKISTTAYCWNKDTDDYEYAISYNGEDWKYTSKEDFDFYNAVNVWSPWPEGFVETIEIVSLQYNTYRISEEPTLPSTGSTSPSSPEATEHTHDYAVEVVAPTCTENGHTVYICKCGDTYTDNVMAATGHTYTSVVTPPTEKEQGYTTHTCICGDSYVDSYMDPVLLIASGTCGENLTWQLEESGLLTILGTGNMTTWSELSEVPWYEYRRQITAVAMQEGVSNIGEMTFCDCNILNSVAIPESVIHIGEMAFAFCEGLTGIIIPDSVATIGNYAFMGCSGLTSINIPEKVTSIGNSAFIRCAALERITIPNSVTSIGDNAFHDCFGLISIIIPDSVVSIGSKAFRRCTGLSSITLPSSVTSIAGDAFEGCTGLTSISVDPDNMVYHSSGNCIIQTSAKELVIGCKTSTIPADGTVARIGDYAFSQCSELNSITIPDGVTHIGQRAFANCSGLASIRITDGVTSIGYCAFSGCIGLSRITIPASVSSISPQAFAFCSGLTSLAVEPDNTVYHSAGNCIIKTDTKTIIAGCDASIIPTDGSVTCIGDEAFWYCEGLTSITIPDSITSIGSAAFYGCSGLINITFEGTAEQWNALEKGSNWDYSNGDYTIHCTDGVISKDDV